MPPLPLRGQPWPELDSGGGVWQDAARRRRSLSQRRDHRGNRPVRFGAHMAGNALTGYINGMTESLRATEISAADHRCRWCCAGSYGRIPGDPSATRSCVLTRAVDRSRTTARRSSIDTTRAATGMYRAVPTEEDDGRMWSTSESAAEPSRQSPRYRDRGSASHPGTESELDPGNARTAASISVSRGVSPCVFPRAPVQARGTIPGVVFSMTVRICSIPAGFHRKHWRVAQDRDALVRTAASRLCSLSASITATSVKAGILPVEDSQSDHDQSARTRVSGVHYPRGHAVHPRRYLSRAAVEHRIRRPFLWRHRSFENRR